MKRRRFGRVRQLPSGRWQARHTGPDGLDRSLGTFATKRDADRALAAVETDLNRGAWVDPQAGSQWLETYADRWLDMRRLRPRTRELYREQLRLRILPTLGHLPINKVTPQVVREWHASLAAASTATGRGAAAVSTSYRVLRAILATAVEDELLPRNPCTIRRAAVDRPSARPTLTERDVWAVAAHVPDRYQAFVWLAAATALRSAELAALRRRDIDLLRKTLRVERAYIEPTSGAAFFGPPKSDAGVRAVPLPDVVVPILYQHLGRFAQPGPDGLLFTSEKGQPISRHNRKWWRRACQDAGIDPRAHLHDLRHAGLTLAAQAGATLKELMALAGHSSPRAAMVYQHAAKGRAAEIAARMSDRLSPPRKDRADTA